jgi:hypothetical protein
MVLFEPAPPMVLVEAAPLPKELLVPAVVARLVLPVLPSVPLT